MRGPQPDRPCLSERQRALLERCTRRHSAPHHLVLRAQLILLAADGLNNSQIATRLGLNRTQVRLWRARWLAAAASLAALEAADPADQHLPATVETLLADAYRSGAPPTFSPEQVCQLVALACEPPADSGLPLSHWTSLALAAEAIKRGIVETISARSVGRFLNAGRDQAASQSLLVASQGR